MQKVKNLKSTVLVIPDGPNGKCVRFGPREVVELETIPESVTRAQRLGYVRILYDRPAQPRNTGNRNSVNKRSENKNAGNKRQGISNAVKKDSGSGGLESQNTEGKK